MTGELSKDNLLRSWKEIAAYLGCDIRTCHRWEDQRGMPVHRAEGAEARSPVFAYKDELDAWFRGTFTSSNHVRDRARGVPGWVKWGAAALLVVAAGAALFLGQRAPRQAADFTVEDQSLVILDKDRRELGRFDTGLEGLMDGPYFKQHFRTLRDQPDDRLPSIDIRDLDADGRNEVLFAPRTSWEQTGLGQLYCLGPDGRVRWSFKAGREIVCGGRTYSPDYRVTGFYCHDIDGDGRLEVLVLAYHKPDWPCQLAVLDGAGRMIGEYWNAGYLRYPVFKDINGDGRDELAVVGVNNEYGGGCLAVFDPRDIRGGSPQSGRFACPEIGPGSQLAYLTVPYTDVSAARGIVVEGLHYAAVLGNDRIQAVYGDSLFYEFAFDLSCVQVYGGHGYEYEHAEMLKAGRLTSVLDDAYYRRLAVGVRYWDGTAWTSAPSWCRR